MTKSKNGNSARHSLKLTETTTFQCLTFKISIYQIFNVSIFKFQNLFMFFSMLKVPNLSTDPDPQLLLHHISITASALHDAIAVLEHRDAVWCSNQRPHRHRLWLQRPVSDTTCVAIFMDMTVFWLQP